MVLTTPQEVGSAIRRRNGTKNKNYRSHAQRQVYKIWLDWFEKFCMKFNTTIVVVNNEDLSPQEELVQDIVSILQIFSCRLYGLRKYKKQIEGDKEIAKELQDGNKSDSRTENQD